MRFILLRERERESAIEFSLAQDVLLKEVGQALTKFAREHLRPLLRDSQAHPRAKELAAQLLLLQWRSRDAFLDFEEFYCIRLLLDQQSALASYFIDLFSQLHWMLSSLYSLHHSNTHDRHSWLYVRVHRIAVSCRLLYAAYKMLPSDQEFKRAGQVGRMFSSNKLHCKMRQVGFANLDQPGQSVVCLKEELGRGAFATVYKGVFEANHAVEKSQKRIIGDAVAVKMFASDNNRSEKGTSFGGQLLQSMKGAMLPEGSDNNRSEKGTSFGGQLLQSMKGAVLPEGSDDVKDARLKIELGRLVSVRHPNIVTPRGYIGKRPQGDSGLVMEVMDETLHDYLTKVKEGSLAALTELQMLDLMLEIAKGMRALHECNLMHRDLKPRNVLLRYLADQDLGCKRFEVKLADFGLIKLYSLAQDGLKDDKHTHTAPVGTSCYMAPELHTGSALTKMSLHEEKLDVFSYGTTCFNILLGNPDPEAFVPSRKAFYEAVKTGQWKQWLWGFERNRSRMVQVVARCWETDPSLRPTFAILCSLLQHNLRLCLTSGLQQCCSRSLKGLKSFQALAVEQYFEHCKSILWSLHQYPVVVLNTTERIVHNFDVLQRPLVPKVVELNDYAKDVGMYLDALKRYNLSKGPAVARWPKLLLGNQNMSESKTFDSCLQTSDPLVFIKGLACHTIFDHSPRHPPAQHSEPPSPFDFTNDEAHSQLQLDASLVPLLVGFWTLTDFDSSVSFSFFRDVKDPWRASTGNNNLRAFSFSVLKAATCNFRPDSVIGEGGFGCVFKGWIDEQGYTASQPGTGLVIAVEKLNLKGLQGHRERLAKVHFLGQLYHPNLVRLIGFCAEDDHRLLVYEFMQRGSLENHLFRRGNSNQALSWAIRIKIAVGAARGLAFLQERPVIYRDFKTSNILLDLHFNAKLYYFGLDFGLGNDGTIVDDTHVSTRVIGTLAYAAPEYVATGHLTAKSVVYSFGVVLLEILTGRRALDLEKPGGERNLVEWAKPYLNDKRVLQIVDPRLQGQYSMEGAHRVATLASSCLCTEARIRPLMKEVVELLEPLGLPRALTGYDNVGF